MSQQPDLKDEVNKALFIKYTQYNKQLDGIITLIEEGKSPFDAETILKAVPFINNRLKPLIKKRIDELFLNEKKFQDAVVTSKEGQLFTLKDFTDTGGSNLKNLILRLKGTKKDNKDEMEVILSKNFNDVVISKLVSKNRLYKGQIETSPLYKNTLVDNDLYNYYNDFEKNFNDVIISLNNSIDLSSFKTEETIKRFSEDVDKLSSLIDEVIDRFKSRDIKASPTSIEVTNSDPFSDLPPSERSKYFNNFYGTESSSNSMGQKIRDYIIPNRESITARLQVFHDQRATKFFQSPSSMVISSTSLDNAIKYLIILGKFSEEEEDLDSLKSEDEKHDKIIVLWTKIMNGLLSHLEMLKLASLNVDIIIRKFLVDMKNSLGRTAWDNLVLLFMGVFYVNIIEIEKTLPAISAPDKAEYERRRDIDGKNFLKFYKAVFDPPGCNDDEVCFFKSNLDPKRKLVLNSNIYEEAIQPLYLPTFIKFLPLLFKANSNFKLTVVAYIARLIETNILRDFVIFVQDNLIDKFEKKESLYTILQESILESYSPILTYVRIRGTTKGETQVSYNRRFNIKINAERPTLLIGYNDHNFPYYDRTSDVPRLEPKLKEKIEAYNKVYDKAPQGYIKTFGTSDKLQGGLDGEWLLDYDNKYVIGPFTRVFHSIENNQIIAGKVDEIFNLLMERKTVFVMGYGASGAGKTSALIYFNKGNKPEEIQGILSHLCNRMGEKNFTRVNVTSCEFFTNSKNQSSSKPVVRRMGATEEAETFKFIKFEYRGPKTGFVLEKGFDDSDSYDHMNDDLNIDRISDCSKVGAHKKDGKCVKRFIKGSELGEVLVHIIDSDRYVKATTNNPNSSRSHAMICISFENDDDEGQSNPNKPTLIIGDFAGVENAFECNDRDVLQRFVNIHEKNDPELEYFYQKYNIEGACGEGSYTCPPETAADAAGGKMTKKMTGGVAAEIPVQGCAFDKEDMYSFSETKFTRPFKNENKDKFFTEFPLIYTAIEKLLLNKYGINVNEDIVQSFKNEILEINLQKLPFEEKKKRLTTLYDRKIKIWEPKILKKDLDYNSETLQKLKKAAIGAGESADSINQFTVMADDLKKIFELVESASSATDILEFIKTFLKNMGFEFITEWSKASQTYIKLAELKDTIDTKRKNSPSGKLYYGMDILNGYPGDIKDWIKDIKDKITFKEIPTENVDVYILADDTEKSWFKTGPGMSASVKDTVVFKNPSKPSEKRTVNLNEFTLNYTDVNPNDPDHTFKWKQPFIEDIVQAHPAAVVSPYNQFTKHYFQEKFINEWSENSVRAINNFYKDVLEKIFDPPEAGPTGPDATEANVSAYIAKIKGHNVKQVESKIKAAYEDFWVKMINDPNNPDAQFKLFYKDPISGEYNFGTINKEYIIGMMRDIVAKNLLFSEIITGTSKITQNIESVQKFSQGIKKWGEDFTFKLNRLELPASFNTSDAKFWYDIIDTINMRLPSLLKGFMCKYPLAYDICKVRLIEGQFINDSLTKMRDFIKQLIDTKLENSLSPLPLFEDVCIPNDYCDKDGNCFTGPTSKEYSDKNSPNILMLELQKMVNASLQISSKKQSSSAAKPKFDLNQLNLCIFCVLNIAIDKATNNPPPIPYIDTIKLKKVMLDLRYALSKSKTKSKTRNWEEEEEDSGGNIVFKLDKKLYLEKEKLRFKLNHELKTLSEDMGETLRKSGAWVKTVSSIDEYLLTKYTLEPFETAGYADIENKIFINATIRKDSTPKSNTKASFDKVFSDVNSLIREISKVNAASAIGTLEFIDQVSKYYLTNGMCSPDGFDNISVNGQEDGWYDIKDTDWIKKSAGGGVKKIKKVGKKVNSKIKNIIIK